MKEERMERFSRKPTRKENTRETPEVDGKIILKQILEKKDFCEDGNEPSVFKKCCEILKHSELLSL
jgi:hypothetical protein